MSGTRLRFQKAPATEKSATSSLLIVAHGERGGAGNDRLVYEIAEQARLRSDYSGVHGCFISKEPSLKSVIEDLPAGPVTVYPLFMSDGYFVSKAIPRSIGNSHRANVMIPVGLNRQLPRLVADVARQAAQSTGWSASACQLLLAAHGSKHDRASYNATEDVAETIRTMNQFAMVSTSFLEERPFVDQQLADIGGPVLVAGLFIGQGMHGSEDVPRAVRECGRDDVVLLPPMTRWPGLVELICRDLSKQAEVRPAASPPSLKSPDIAS